VRAARATPANAQAGVSPAQSDLDRLRAAQADAQRNLGWTKVISLITGDLTSGSCVSDRPRVQRSW